MKLLNGILYLQVADWAQAGLTRNYPSRVLCESISTMNVVPDPEDGRAILIEWSSIKNPKHRQAILDTFGEPEQFFQHYGCLCSGILALGRGCACFRCVHK